MNLYPPLDLQEATRLVRAGRLTDATAAIQRLLASQTSPGGFPAIGQGSMLDRLIPSLDIDLAETSPMLRQDPGRESTFVAQTFSNHAGSRPYKLYIPSGYHGRPVPLIVMLHGCSQSPDDFAAGTRMNLAAEAQTFMVAYPAQTKAANMQKCWNWFSPTDQQRDSGEPSLIAGITRQVMRDHAIDPARVYVAGLSAGGAAASIMGNAYSDLYAAIGVHSGLACGAARDLYTAFSVMQSGGHGQIRFDRRRVVPAIVFHGERDSTVNVRNGDAVVAQTVNGMSLRIQVETGQVPGGHAYTRMLHIDADGDTLVEKWIVQGAGHAWFGGSSAGSYTDPRGPDATKEMLRFFRKHAL